jgi:hypothetical protein
MDDLEQIIADLIDRKYSAEEGSAEYRMVMRQLRGLRYGYKDAGPIMEDLDPDGWGAIDVAHPVPPKRVP